MSIEDRREVVQELAEEGLTQREIAAVVGVDVATVNRDVSVAHATDHPEHTNNHADISVPTVANATENVELTPIPDPPLLSIVDLDTGEVVEPAADRWDGVSIADNPVSPQSVASGAQGRVRK